MGMASSQARLLTLTTRMHQIEYKAAKLEAEKLQMANESQRVYETYLNALEATKIEKSGFNTDASTTYTPLTAKDIYTYHGLSKQYVLQAMNGKVFVPESFHNAYNNTDTMAEFLNAYDIGPEGTAVIHHPEYNPHAGEKNLSREFQRAGSSCYNSAVNYNSVGCYAHVLAHIIDYTEETGLGTPSQHGCNDNFYNSAANSYTTTTGRNFSINSSDITTAGMDDDGGENDQTMALVSEYLNKNLPATILDDDKTFAETDLSTEPKRLASMYNTDGSTKTLKQWAEDLYYLCKNYSDLGVEAEEVTPTITDFQRHLSSDLDKDIVPAYDETVDTVIADDPAKAQWYSNLWNAMDNSKTSNVSTDLDAYTTNDGSTVVGYQVISHPKSETNYTTNKFFNTIENENYIVIPDDMYESYEWLTNMINSGYAILQTYDRKEEKLLYTSVSVDPDLREVPDKKELKKAEAKYEADMRKIDLKDRKYDMELSAIETERNAIKNEMETLKTVTKENVERTFKLFG